MRLHFKTLFRYWILSLVLLHSLNVRAQIKDRHFTQISKTYSVKTTEGAQTRSQFSLSSGTSLSSKSAKKTRQQPNLRILNKFQFSKSRTLNKPKKVPVHRPSSSKPSKSVSNS